MPLLKRKPFSLLEPPKDLDPKEKIFQIRFTKEIFRDYQYPFCMTILEYLKRVNLYRQRLWTCKVSGKSNLTFEEALVSEHNAMEKAQKLPAELMAYVLRMTQYNDGNTGVPVKYPIDDLLLRPAGDDPALSKRPLLATDFRVPRYSVGDLLMVSLVTWGEYLCDFLEMTKIEDLASNISTVRRGYYGLLDTAIKLKVLRELVEEAVTTSAIRELLIERVDQKQALTATRKKSIRAEKEEQNLNPETGAENKKEQIDGVQDGGGSIDDQVRGTEEVDKNNISRGKTDGKQHLVRKLDTEYEKLSIRSSPLGKDRDYNRYWFFRREGRIFVENADSREWGYYSTKEELDALIDSLNMKGIRERALKKQLEKCYSKISNALEKRSKDIAHKMLLEEAVLRRSTRVRAQPKDNPSMAFLKYVNKWKDN
ncbi:hypothetical protein PR202_ga01695 [Eleusine coracana subsp. coracana]|uniref:WAC domain-containing protein n=1 Tax=Eleusine coracana subsp. coracana TaxID=191504 RepID=A0AAV5BHN9_ELECO|nr:hypothetical protein PR202_ga01008 [Eleusine coracana subsp. coracana]GJM85888.1 hypothetical protein PR202_ga01695 [Eleusine coracana subsp. coracana]